MNDHTISLLVAMGHGLGLMALLGIVFGTVERLPLPPLMRSLLQGVFFGVGAIFAMLQPVAIGGGIQLDSRSIIVGLAGAFCGAPAAVVSVILAVLFRLHLGGAGFVAGTIGILLAAGSGLAWARWLKPARQLLLIDFTALGILVSLYLATFVLLPSPAARSLLVHAVPPMMLTSIIASIVLGSFIERERRHISKETHWRFSAMTDALTGLANRRRFEETLAHLEATAEGSDFAVLIIDADHFKDINDTHGHVAGDAALRALARQIQISVRAEDSVCRIGGEEFAVILPNASPELALLIATRIRVAIEALEITDANAAFRMTVSIGATMASQARRKNTSIVSEADAALYEAKKSGRNRIVGLTPRYESVGADSRIRVN